MAGFNGPKGHSPYSKTNLSDVEAGRVPGSSITHKFGSCPDIDTSYEDVWTLGGDYYFPPVTAAMEVVSSSSSDTSAGSGARTIQVRGLDGDYAEQTVTATLNGATAVALSASFLRVNRMQVKTVGTGVTNAGTISCRIAGAATVQAQIPTNYNQTMMAIYTIPAEKTGYLQHFYFSTAKAKDCTARMLVRELNGAFAVTSEINSYQNYVRHPFSGGLAIPAKSDVKVRAISANVNTKVQAGFDILLEPA